MMIDEKKFEELFSNITTFKQNPYHPLVWIVGNPKIGKNVYIGGMSEIQSNNAEVTIGDNCDIASFVSINCADSHQKCIGLSDKIDRRNIVFIGSHCVIKGGAYIGHHSVIAAGSVVDGVKINPYSLVIGNPMKIKDGYYTEKINRSS